jgi:hypothetical protein
MPRLSEYTEEMADKICALVEGGSNLTKIGQMDDMPCRDTIYKWKRENEAFGNNYTRARQCQGGLSDLLKERHLGSGSIEM